MFQFLTRLFSRQERTVERVETALDRMATAAEKMAAGWEMAEALVTARLGLVEEAPGGKLLEDHTEAAPAAKNGRAKKPVSA